MQELGPLANEHRSLDLASDQQACGPLPGRPATIVSDNGTELTGHAILNWHNLTTVGWYDIRPGRPMRDFFVETFNVSLRDKFLNETGFHAGPALQDLRRDYNNVQTRSRLDGLATSTYAANAAIG